MIHKRKAMLVLVVGVLPLTCVSRGPLVADANELAKRVKELLEGGQVSEALRTIDKGEKVDDWCLMYRQEDPNLPPTCTQAAHPKFLKQLRVVAQKAVPCEKLLAECSDGDVGRMTARHCLLELPKKCEFDSPLGYLRVGNASSLVDSLKRKIHLTRYRADRFAPSEDLADAQNSCLDGMTWGFYRLPESGKAYAGQGTPVAEFSGGFDTMLDCDEARLSVAEHLRAREDKGCHQEYFGVVQTVKLFKVDYEGPPTPKAPVGIKGSAFFSSQETCDRVTQRKFRARRESIVSGSAQLLTVHPRGGKGNITVTSPCTEHEVVVCDSGSVPERIAEIMVIE